MSTMAESQHAADSRTQPPAATNIRKEHLLLAVLAAIQFTNILDFVIIMPLGPQFMRVFGVGSQEFGLIVSSYTFSSGFFGLLGAFFVDRFDRRTALLFLYTGFAIGTGMCALAPNYILLIAARVLAGAFGGVLASVILSIVGDVIPYERRGAAMGVIMSSFSLATVIGVPIGLYIATEFGWHWTFTSLAGISALILLIASQVVPPIHGHLAQAIVRNPLETLKFMLENKNYLKVYAFMIMLMLAGFTVFPFISPYLVYNVGLEEGELTYVYALGGFCTFFSSRYIGRLADRYGKQRVFVYLAFMSTVPIFLMTVLPPLPLILVLVFSAFFFVLASGRGVPAFAMITASVESKNRGSFMSFNTSVQHWSAGLGSFVAGLVIVSGSDRALHNFGWVGAFAVSATVICVFLSKRLVRVEENLS